MNKKTFAPINWKARPEKFCFAPCPPGKWCECAERRKHERYELRECQRTQSEIKRQEKQKKSR